MKLILHISRSGIRLRDKVTGNKERKSGDTYKRKSHRKIKEKEKETGSRNMIPTNVETSMDKEDNSDNYDTSKNDANIMH
jgi:hypothetical protein